MTNTSEPSTSFAAIENSDAHILILGSMPGIESLKQQRYYAHPRNAFWPIMAKLFNMDKETSYQQRCNTLINHHIAVWDVLQSCQRQGSLDNNIQTSSIVINDFANFLQLHQHIKLIAFNGSKAEQIFTKHVLTTLTETQADITRKRLPSTSPAHAAMSFEQKCHYWQQALFG